MISKQDEGLEIDNDVAAHTRQRGACLSGERSDELPMGAAPAAVHGPMTSAWQPSDVGAQSVQGMAPVSAANA